MNAIEIKCWYGSGWYAIPMCIHTLFVIGLTGMKCRAKHCMFVLFIDKEAVRHAGAIAMVDFCIGRYLLSCHNDLPQEQLC